MFRPIDEEQKLVLKVLGKTCDYPNCDKAPEIERSISKQGSIPLVTNYCVEHAAKMEAEGVFR